VEASQVIPVRQTERMMKLQDVSLKAMAKKLSWIETAEIAGMGAQHAADAAELPGGRL
jgi:hypothetical protein